MKPLWKCPKEERAKAISRREEILAKYADLRMTIQNLQDIINGHEKTLQKLNRDLTLLYREYDFEVDNEGGSLIEVFSKIVKEYFSKAKPLDKIQFPDKLTP